jgi:DNA helicase-2/ATP-dependent DNA helicase PcrA
LSKEADELCKGDIIEHERFGRGVVGEIESAGSDKRAFVDFDSVGRKQLLLKFAKFKIVK